MLTLPETVVHGEDLGWVQQVQLHEEKVHVARVVSLHVLVPSLHLRVHPLRVAHLRTQRVRPVIPGRKLRASTNEETKIEKQSVLRLTPGKRKSQTCSSKLRIGVGVRRNLDKCECFRA